MAQMKNDKCTCRTCYWQKRFYFLLAVERKSKLLTENEMGNSLGDDIDEVILVKHAVNWHAVGFAMLHYATAAQYIIQNSWYCENV